MYICCCDCIVKSYGCFLVSECFKICKVNNNNLCILCKIIIVLICNIFLIIVFINMLL